MTVFDEQGTAPVELTVIDQGLHLANIRTAKGDEFGHNPPGLVFDQIGAVALEGGGSEILILWAGLSCDKSATLTVDPRQNLVTMTPDPVGNCDLAPTVRGVVLDFVEPGSVATMRLVLRPTPIIEAS